MASADPAAPAPPGERDLVPPKMSAYPPEGDLVPPSAALDANANGLPPFKRRPEPKPDALPSPFAPKGDPPVMPPPAQPGAADSTAKTRAELKAILATANTAWKALDTFEATLTRREVDPRGELNSEVLLFQFRREPMSMYTLNVGENGKGRETVYNKKTDKLHVKLGKGDPFPGAGFVAPPLSPDDPRVKAKARYSVRDSGPGRNLLTLNVAVAQLEAGKAPVDSVVFDGAVKRSEYSYPLAGVTHRLRAGDDPLFPNGGTRLYFFDTKKDSPSYGLPVLVIATDAAGKEVEYYLYEKVKAPAGLTDADFDPARLSKKR
jgi:hypothetical protein